MLTALCLSVEAHAQIVTTNVTQSPTNPAPLKLLAITASGHVQQTLWSSVSNAATTVASGLVDSASNALYSAIGTASGSLDTNSSFFTNLPEQSATSPLRSQATNDANTMATAVVAANIASGLIVPITTLNTKTGQVYAAATAYTDATAGALQQTNLFYYKAQSGIVADNPSIAVRLNTTNYLRTNDFFEIAVSGDYTAGQEVPGGIQVIGYNRLWVFNFFDENLSIDDPDAVTIHSWTNAWPSSAVDFGREGILWHTVELNNTNFWGSTNNVVTVWTNNATGEAAIDHTTNAIGSDYTFAFQTNGPPRRNYHECVVIRPGNYVFPNLSAQTDLEYGTGAWDSSVYIPAGFQVLQSKVPLAFVWNGDFPYGPNDSQGWNAFSQRDAPFITMTGPNASTSPSTNSMTSGFIMQTAFDSTGGQVVGGLNKYRKMRGYPASPAAAQNGDMIWQHQYGAHSGSMFYVRADQQTWIDSNGRGKFRFVLDNSADPGGGDEVAPLTIGGAGDGYVGATYLRVTNDTHLAGSLNIATNAAPITMIDRGTGSQVSLCVSNGAIVIY